MPPRCCVTNCRGNYDNEARVAIFSYPKDEELKKRWIRSIPRKDFKATPSSKDCLATLPINLCLKRCDHPVGAYGVWSLKEIPSKMRFGPYRGVFKDRYERQKKSGFQWKVERNEKEITILDGHNEKESNWVRYVNYAFNKDEQNLIAVQSQSKVYYVTSKSIPAYTQLLVWYQGKFDDKTIRTEDSKSSLIEKGRNEDMTIADKSYIYEKKDRNPNINEDGYTTSQNDLRKKILSMNVKTAKKTQLHVQRTFTCNNSDEGTTTNHAIRGHERIHIGEKPYKCKICGKKFTRLYRLKSHESTHTGKKPYECKICGKKFTQICHLKSHERIHTGEKPYECKICGKTFFRNCYLKSHERIHTGEKSYECKICGKKFTRNCYLKSHEKIHTGEKPYQCNLCGKKFTHSSSLTSHKRIHTGEKPYECKICGKKFTMICYLKTHERIHTGEKPYECKICGKKFSQNCQIKSHERIHTGEKPYQCNLCGKKFTHSNSLRSHKRIHTGEKLYECKICGKKLTQIRYLKSHERIHTGEKPNECKIYGKKFSESRTLINHKNIH